MTIIKRIKNIGRGILLIGGLITLLLGGCSNYEETNIYSIEQRGTSPVKLVELIRRDYLFTSKDKILVTEQTAASSVPRTGLYTSWHDTYYINDEENVKRLHGKLKKQEERNNQVLNEWNENYSLHRGY